MPPIINILLFQCDPLVALSLNLLFSATTDCLVRGEAVDLSQLEQQSFTLRPDVIVMMGGG
jgi:DNA-binding NarL/FixJ family response regulator